MLDNPKVDLHIGRIQDSKLFKGRIDGVRLYTRAGRDGDSGVGHAGPQGRVVLKSPPVKPEDVTLVLGGREFMATRHQPAFLAVRLPAGPMEFSAKTSPALRRIR